MPIPPPVLALAAGLLQRRLPGAATAPGGVRALSSAVLTAGSVVVAGSASARFQRRGTTVQPFHPERASVLVTEGANAVSRNPMYAGLAGLLLAHAAWRGSWVALLPVAAFVAVIDRVQIPAEEAALGAKFGADYEAYRARTPRWLDHRSLDVTRAFG